MKKLLIALALAASAAAYGQTAAPGPARAISEEQALKALDLSWHQAVAARDVDALGRLLADDYRFDVDAKRMLTKAQEMEAVKASAPPFAFGPFKLKDVSVSVDGERATVSGTLTVKPDGGDKNSRRRYFYARTFVRRDGRWQVLTAGLATLAKVDY